MALDLTATLAGRLGNPTEQLAVPADLADWLLAAGLLERAPDVSELQLKHARELREASHALVTDAATAPQRTEAAEFVNRWAARPRPALRLEPRTQAITQVTARPVEAALAEVAHDLLRLLRDEPHRVRRCARPGCSVLFVDRSRGASRRWCDMKVCGNVDKVATYRRRRKTRKALA